MLRGAAAGRVGVLPLLGHLLREELQEILVRREARPDGLLRPLDVARERVSPGLRLVAPQDGQQREERDREQPEDEVRQDPDAHTG